MHCGHRTGSYDLYLLEFFEDFCVLYWFSSKICLIELKTNVYSLWGKFRFYIPIHSKFVNHKFGKLANFCHFLSVSFTVRSIKTILLLWRTAQFLKILWFLWHIWDHVFKCGEFFFNLCSWTSKAGLTEDFQ